MAYQNNQPVVYSGASYEAANAPTARGIQFAQQVKDETARKGIAAIARNIGVFGEVLQKRHKDKRDNENQLDLQQIEHERKMEMERRMQLPNGAEGSFYDKNGQPDTLAFQRFTDSYIKRALQTNTGYASLEDKQQRDLYLQKYVLNMRMDGEAAFIGSIKQRGMKAFNDSYKLYMAQDDFGSAAQAAKEAYRNNILSEDEMKLYLLNAKKGNARKMSAGANRAGASALNDAFVEAVWERDRRRREKEEAAERAAGEALEGGETGEGVMEPPENKEYRMPPNTGGMETRVQEEVDPLDMEIDLTSPMSFLEGVEAMNTDEFTLTARMLDQKSNRMELLGENGKPFLSGTDGSPEPFQVLSYQTEKTGGISLKEFDMYALAILADEAINPNRAGLKESDKEYREYLEQAITIEGMGAVFFPDDPNPELAQKAHVKDLVNQAMSTRDANIEQRVGAAIDNPHEGFPGLKDQLKELDSFLLSQFKNAEVEELAKAESSIFLSKRQEQASKFSGIFNRYKERYMAEKGYSEKDVVSAADKIKDFKEWFFQKGGAYDEMRADYVKSAKAFLRQRCIEKVAEYRRGGGKDWAEENMTITEAIEEGKKEIKGGGEWAQWRAEKDKRQRELAIDYRNKRKEAERVLKPLQEEANKKKEENAALADRAKWEAQQKKNALHKQWKDEAKEKEKEKAPFKHPVLQTVQVRNDKEKKEVVTVPYEQYDQICEQLEVGDNEGVMVTFGSGRTEYVVRPGDVKTVTLSTPLFNKLAKSKKITQDQLKKAILGHQRMMRYKKVYAF